MAGILSHPSDLVIERLEALADAICGEEETAYTGPEDRVRHALNRMVDQYQKAAGSLPEVSKTDAGKILKVNSDGEWAKAAAELPAVAAADNGKVLTVVNGAWAAALPSDSTPATT